MIGGLEWWEEDDDDNDAYQSQMNPSPSLLEDLRISRQKIRALAELLLRNEQVLTFLWNTLVEVDMIGWDYTEYFYDHANGKELLSEDEPQNLVKLLFRDIDEFWAEWGTEEEKAAALGNIMAHEFSGEDTRRLWRFYSSDVVVRRVWNKPAMNRDFVLHLGQSSPCFGRRSLEEERVFMDSINFVLEDDSVLIKLQDAACKAETPELMLWLLRSGYYSASLVPANAVVHVVNSSCLELLLNDAFDCNVITVQKSILGKRSTVCAMHRIRDSKHVRLLRRGGFQLETLKRVDSLPAYQLCMLLAEWSTEFKKMFVMEEILNRADFPHEYVQVS